MKRGRPIGSKDKNPRKRKGINDQDDHGLKEISQDETQVITYNDEEVRTSKNNEISMNYVSTRKLWNRNNVVIDNNFAYNVAIDICNKMKILSQNMFTHVDREMIGQNGRMLFK